MLFPQHWFRTRTQGNTEEFGPAWRQPPLPEVESSRPGELVHCCGRVAEGFAKDRTQFPQVVPLLQLGAQHRISVPTDYPICADSLPCRPSLPARARRGLRAVQPRLRRNDEGCQRVAGGFLYPPSGPVVRRTGAWREWTWPSPPPASPRSQAPRRARHSPPQGASMRRYTRHPWFPRTLVRATVPCSG